MRNVSNATWIKLYPGSEGHINRSHTPRSDDGAERRSASAVTVLGLTAQRAQAPSYAFLISCSAQATASFVGIPPTALAHIFGRMYELKTSGAPRVGGPGQPDSADQLANPIK